MANEIIKILKNTTQSNIDVYGVRINPNGEYEIPFSEIDGFLNDTNLLNWIMDGSIIVNNGTDDLPALDGWEWLNTFYIDTSGGAGGSGHICWGASRNGTQGKGYLRTYNGTVMSKYIGWVAPYDGAIVAMSVSRDNTTYGELGIRINGSSTQAQLWTSERSAYINTLDVSFSAGDVLSVYMEWGSMRKPVINIFCKWVD